MFLLFLIVTRETLGTGFRPSFRIALRLFFSLRDCLEPPAFHVEVLERRKGREASGSVSRPERKSDDGQTRSSSEDEHHL
jgi:hypothetical protein